MSKKNLLTIDGIVNLLLGIILILFPASLISLLGIPETESKFYPNILGAVFFGIGISLMLERYKHLFNINGLGLGGAISINLCGGVMLAAWLLSGNLEIPTKGIIILWLVVAVLVGISFIEIKELIHLRHRGKSIQS